MPRYRNVGSMPLNYGDRGPFVVPGEEFDTADYPLFPMDQLASHLRSGFVYEVTAAIVDELHEHADRALIDALDRSPRKRKATT